MPAKTTSSKAYSATRTKLLGALLLLLAVFAASCNLRENSLLPEHLDPLQYVTSNTIKVYKDHLIGSENDKSYLYIPKESIHDYKLWYNDVVRLRRVDSLLERDSLAFAEGVEAVTRCYRISIERYGTEIILDSIPAFATLYTDLTTSESVAEAWVVRSQYMLYADKLPLQTYGNNRVYFEIDGNGDVEAQRPGNANVFNLPAANTNVEALHYSDSGNLQIWFPQAYLTSAGQTRLEILPQLGDADVSAVQAVYPGFALNTGVLDVQTQSVPDVVSPPILHWSQPPARKFVQEWVRLQGGQVFGWAQGPETWLVQNNVLISFLQGSGKYFLLSPLGEQTALELPLDGSFDQLYLQDLWLDLRDTALPNHSLRLDTAPNPASVISTYFSGAPFTLGGAHQAFQLDFRSGNSTVETLPGDNWIEFGFRNQLAESSNARLFRVFRSSGSDHIDFKARGDAYDASHYSLSDGFVYSGVNSSGTYLLGQVGESGQQQSFPFFKPETSIQTSRGYVSWNDPDTAWGSLLLEYSVAMPTGHPWLSGQPYVFSAQNALLRVTAYTRGKKRSPSLPDNTFLVYKHASPLQNLINFSPDADHPRFAWYKAAAAFAHNTFMYQDGALSVSPAWSGYLFSGGSLDPGTASNLRLYQRMSFDNYDWEYYADASATPSGTPVLQIARLNSVPDSHGVLAGQYDLSPLTPAWSLSVSGSSDFYVSQLPWIRFRQNIRPQNLLFSVYEGEFYRVYPYYQTTGADPWHFTYADGHVGFFLSSDAIYAPMIDSNPHQSVSTQVTSNVAEHIVSLYQAQLNLPSSLIGNPVPLNSRIILSEAVDYAVPHLSAYFLDFRTAAGTQYDPNFYTQAGAASLPYIYIPIPDYVPGQSHSLFFRSVEGTLTEFTLVDEFGDNGLGEYILVGNCAVALVDGPGWFYTTN